MKRTKLNYRFYNPNTPEMSAEHLIRIFIESGAKKIEQAMIDAQDARSKREKSPESNFCKE